MNIVELQDTLTKLNVNISNREISQIWGMDESSFSRKKREGSEIKHKNIIQLERALKIDLIPKASVEERIAALQEKLNISDTKEQFYDIIYRPEVCFSAGYGIEVLDESNIETIKLDKKLFYTEKGLAINPNMCEVLTVSGNSMSPRWEHGDRFILDKSVTRFIDGQIFAFRHNGECYIKEICLLGKRAKAVPLNKDYDPFYIEPEDDLKIFGRVLPRVRL